MIRCMLDENAYFPYKAHPTDAGFDLRTYCRCLVPAHGSCKIHTGIHVEIPYGYVGLIKSKSGLNVNKGLTAEGVIDCGYTGEIIVKMYNHTDNDYTFYEGDKITQLLIIPIHPDNEFTITTSLDKTDRGDGGFGSTGR